jgi:DNA invertase Pin-like site-specific DNA recombinase
MPRFRAELERNLVVERVRGGMRRAEIEARRIRRPPLQVNLEALRRGRERGLRISELARQYGVAETCIRRLLRQAEGAPPKRSVGSPPELVDNTQPGLALGTRQKMWNRKKQGMNN